ncbi:MAG TPA: hypothetical protein VGF82_03490 [Terracidiphilus sp.]|jgi:hypothetical protein
MRMKTGERVGGTADHWIRREIAICLATILVFPLGTATGFAQQTAPSPAMAGAPSSSQPPAQNRNSGNAKPEGGAIQAPDDNPQPAASKTTQEQQNVGTPAPVGTAVAPYEKGIGVAASRPAGAVIAPAKQRRSRSFIIKVSLVIGACVAVGTVVALSNASPSQPH